MSRLVRGPGTRAATRVRRRAAASDGDASGPPAGTRCLGVERPCWRIAPGVADGRRPPGRGGWLMHGQSKRSLGRGRVRLARFRRSARGRASWLADDLSSDELPRLDDGREGWPEHGPSRPPTDQRVPQVACHGGRTCSATATAPLADGPRSGGSLPPLPQRRTSRGATANPTHSSTSSRGKGAGSRPDGADPDRDSRGDCDRARRWRQGA